MQTTELWPFALYTGLVFSLVALVVGLSHALGQRHMEKATGEPFESGVIPVGMARLRFAAKFYLVAVLFVIFDMEAVFLFAWAVALREVGWSGYLGALFFILILSVALLYEWRVGALDWAPPGQKNPKPGRG